MKWNLPPKYLHLSIILCGSYVGVAYTYKYACYLHSINSVFKLCMFAFVMFVCNVVSAYDIVCVCVRVTWCVCVCVTCVCVCACDVVCVSVCDMVCVCVTVWHGMCVTWCVCLCVCVTRCVCEMWYSPSPVCSMFCWCNLLQTRKGHHCTSKAPQITSYYMVSVMTDDSPTIPLSSHWVTARYLKSHPIKRFQWFPYHPSLAPTGYSKGPTNTPIIQFLQYYQYLVYEVVHIRL